MSRRRLHLLVTAVLLLGTLAGGRAAAQGGGSVADFTLQGSGGNVALRNYSGSKAVVVIFVNPTCAFTRFYQSRLAALSSSYSGRGVQFLFINVPINLETPEPGPGSLDLPTLSDESQQVSSLLGVSKTTEAVVLQPGSSGFVVRYHGAIDDNPQVAGSVQQRYLQQVLDNLLAGRPAGIEGKRAAGCLIKK